jgi:hypothetical protein
MRPNNRTRGSLDDRNPQIVTVPAARIRLSSKAFILL